MDGTTQGLGLLMAGALASLSFVLFNALLIIAGIIDARSRRFPNALAAVMAVVALLAAAFAAYRGALLDVGSMTAGTGFSGTGGLGSGAGLSGVGSMGAGAELSGIDASVAATDRALLLVTLKHLAGPVVAALATCAALVGFELLWRRVRGTAGLGMGDVKLLFCLMLVSPARGLFSFAAGLVLLAACCLMLRKRDLPLIPFIAAVWLALLVIAFAFAAK